MQRAAARTGTKFQTSVRRVVRPVEVPTTKLTTRSCHGHVSTSGGSPALTANIARSVSNAARNPSARKNTQPTVTSANVTIHRARRVPGDVAALASPNRRSSASNRP